VIGRVIVRQDHLVRCRYLAFEVVQQHFCPLVAADHILVPTQPVTSIRSYKTYMGFADILALSFMTFHSQKAPNSSVFQESNNAREIFV